MGRIIAKRLKGMNWMAKVSLILIFTLVFSTFIYQGWYKPKFSGATPTANGRIVHSVNTATPTDKIYTASSNTFVAGSAMTAGAAAPTFIVNRSAPTRDESMAGFVTTTGVLHIYKRNGATWIEVTNTAAPDGWGVGTRPTVGGNGVNGRRFDIVYENTAGRAIVVYSNNTSGANELRYRIWDGATSTWTPATSLDSARITGIPNYIKMASKPGSNEVAVTVADAATNTLLTTLIWDGVSAWGGEPTTSHTTAGTNQYVWYTTTVGDSDSFDMAYESVSGNLYVGWNSKTTTDQYHRRRVGATWDASSTAWASTRNGQTFFAVAEPNSNYILAGFDRVASTRTMVRVWNGSAYTANATQVSANNTTPAVNKKFTTGAWLSNGGTTAAVVVWSSSVANSVYYNYSTNYGTSWAGGTAGYAWVPTGALAASGIKWVDLSVDPRSNNDTLMYTFSELNTTNKLWAKRLQFTGPATFTWTNADGGAALTTALTNVTTQSFSFAYDRKDLTPPTAGTVTVSPDYTSTFTSGSPTITTTFTDNETAVTACDYTTNNGTSWFAGVVSGSSPTYTCTGSPTGLSGAVTINMRATSGGGTTTAAAINRTADAAGPTDGTLTAISGGSGGGVGISLSWTAASDGLSGLRATNTYDLRFLVGGTPPTCSTGTSIYTGTGASFVHDGLTANQQYSYSVCAYDNVNNASAGATASAVAKLASTIVSCAGCHGYGAITDGTPRNTPAGTFPGSHNKHVVTAGKVCNVCHVVPATETSVDFKHRDSNIQLKTGATAIDGGYYDKNNNSIYNAGDDTFAQTNAAPSLQTCRTVYCHSQGTSATSNPSDPRLTVSAPLVNLNWGSAGACSSCHGYGPSYVSGTPKANSHSKHMTQCSTCHNTTTTNSTSITGPANHANKLYNIALGNGATIVSYTYAGTGGTCTTISCHYDGTALDASRVWGSGALPATYDCVNCHKVTQAITIGPLAGTAARRAVSLEFANTWSHKRSAVPTGTVTKYDCGVCHMEGSATTGAVDSFYHGDGYIQLRDPDSGLTIKGVTWDGLTPGSYVSTLTDLTFARFSRNLSVALENDPNFLTIAAIQKNHCLACHDTNGAFNASARVTGGVALKPFNTTITGHVAPYDSNGNGNLVDVNKSFLTSNASYHPVRGKANNSYADADTMYAPWNYPPKTAGLTNQWGYLMSCWDCHALSTDSGTITKTVTAHGASATLRAPIRADGSTAATNLCLNCHETQYSSTGGNHSAVGGSAFNVGGNTAMNTYFLNCSYCHAYGPADGAHLATSTARPLRGEDVHGFNDRTAGTVGSVWGTSGVRPYAFIRNILTVWSPLSAPEGTPTHTCVGGSLGNPCNNNMTGDLFTPGGAY